MDDCMSVIQRAAHRVATRRFSYRERTADPFAEAERLTVAEAFGRYAGIDLLATLTPTSADHRSFAVLAHQAGVDSAIDDSWGEHLQPRAGRGRSSPISAMAAPPSCVNTRP
jgi:lysyl-tRNA synthetase class 2